MSVQERGVEFGAVRADNDARDSIARVHDRLSKSHQRIEGRGPGPTLERQRGGEDARSGLILYSVRQLQRGDGVCRRVARALLWFMWCGRSGGVSDWPPPECTPERRRRAPRGVEDVATDDSS